MKKSLSLLIVLITAGLLLANSISPGPNNQLSATQQSNGLNYQKIKRDPPDWSFAIQPTDILLSYYDYMIGSYNGLPVQTLPDNLGGGYFLTFHAKRTSSGTRRVFYSYVGHTGIVANMNEITTQTVLEGYPALDVDSATGVPMYAWHANVDTDTQSEVQLSWDMLTNGVVGTFNDPMIAINNPITMPAPYNTTDNGFIWPVVQIGPSPTAGMRRIYVCGRNNATHVGSTSYPVENMYIAYADFDTATLQAGTTLTWSYTSVPDLDAWNHDTVNYRSPHLGFTVGDDGRIYLMGYHSARTVSGSALIDEPDVDVFACDNYGGGTWTHFTAYGLIPSWNPPTQFGTGPGYFNVASDDDLYWRVTDSGHLNAVFGYDGKLHFSGMWNLTALSGTTEIFEPLLNAIREVQYDVNLQEFSIKEIYPFAGNSGDTQFWQPWDLNGDHVVDAYDSTSGDPDFETDWNYPYWDDTVHSNGMAYQYNNTKVTEPNQQGWMACVWQNCRRARAYNHDNQTEYQPYANVPEIYISVSSDFGNNWSEPIVINSVEVAEFAGNRPMYVYPSDQMKFVGVVNGQPVGRLGLMYYHDNSWGSYVVSPAVGANDGGYVRFMAIDVVMGGTVPSYVTGTVIRSDNQQPIINATVAVGDSTVTTDMTGNYNITVEPGTYSISASAAGYVTVTVPDVTIPMGETITQDFSLSPAVQVMGIVHGTNPPVAIQDALVTLIGIATFTTLTDASGHYTLSVYPFQTYLYIIEKTGYQMASGTINVGGATFNMGVISLLESTDNEDPIQTVHANNFLGVTPNPFCSSTHFSYTLKHDAPVIFEIYNIRGQLVNRMISQVGKRGYNEITWDGKNANGEKSASGVYFCVMKTNEYTGRKKLILLK